MPTYTTQNGQGGEKNLFIDGNQSVCPFVPAIPFQGNMGQVQLMRIPCSTLCPHAFLKEDTYTISCGNHPQTFAIDGNPNNENGKLLYQI